MPTDAELGQFLYSYGRPTAGGGGFGSFSTPFPPTAKAPPYPSTSLEPAIQGLITPGLVPDIARQSAEVTAGRGIGGSPAAASTAVKMSEQDYLQRLGLANQLLSGEASRKLPYDITPYQSSQLSLWLEQLNRQHPSGGLHFPGGGGGGGGAAPVSSFGGGWPNIQAVGGTRQPDVTTSPFVPQTGGYGGGAVGGGGSPSLDDMLRELGIFGEDESGFPDFGGNGYDQGTPGIPEFGDYFE
ncbi:MAG: hypothetical protein V4563_14795 [Pseudomonadota bacterium]